MFDIRKIQEQVIYEAVRKASDERTAAQIVYGAEGNAADSGISREDDAPWVISTMGRLEERFDKAEIKTIRMNCQCGYGMDEKLGLLKELMAASSSLEEFGTLEGAKSAGLFYEDGTLYLQFRHCPCPMLAEVERLETDTWCQCTTGYSKVLFEKAFGCEVAVDLLQSVKMGDERCLMSIKPQGNVIFSGC